MLFKRILTVEHHTDFIMFTLSTVKGFYFVILFIYIIFNSVSNNFAGLKVSVIYNLVGLKLNDHMKFNSASFKAHCKFLLS